MTARLPNLATPRLRLRPYRDTDRHFLCRLFREPDVRRYLLDGQIVTDDWIDQEIANSRELVDSHGCGRWIVERSDDGAPIGITGFVLFAEMTEPELLYAYLPTSWGQGFAYEAAQVAIDYALKVLDWEEVIARTDEPNTQSIALMKRLGMTFAGECTVNGAPNVVFRIRRD